MKKKTLTAVVLRPDCVDPYLAFDVVDLDNTTDEALFNDIVKIIGGTPKAGVCVHGHASCYVPFFSKSVSISTMRNSPDPDAEYGKTANCCATVLFGNHEKAILGNVVILKWDIPDDKIGTGIISVADAVKWLRSMSNKDITHFMEACSNIILTLFKLQEEGEKEGL